MSEMRSTDQQRLEALEIDLLLEGVYRHYGNDFREYDRDLVTRKVNAFMAQNGLKTPSALQDRTLHDASVHAALCRSFMACEGELFDDADEFIALRKSIAPLLKSYPAPKVWLAECLSMEEVFSFAILLAEEIVYDRTFLFVTCSNEELLREIKQGMFPAERIPLYEARYLRSGGKRAFSDHYVIRDNQAFFSEHLRSRIIWSQYNLSTDSSFNEFQLISCRKSILNFTPALQGRILTLFTQSLSVFGLLNIHPASAIERAAHQMRYRSMDARGMSGIYRRTS